MVSKKQLFYEQNCKPNARNYIYPELLEKSIRPSLSNLVGPLGQVGQVGQVAPMSQ